MHHSSTSSSSVQKRLGLAIIKGDEAGVRKAIMEGADANGAVFHYNGMLRIFTAAYVAAVNGGVRDAAITHKGDAGGGRERAAAVGRSALPASLYVPAAQAILADTSVQ